MPTTEVSFRELASMLGGEADITPESIRDRISMLGIDVEHIDEESIVMEVFPCRPDMLGIEGFARALKGFMSLETGLVEYKLEDSGIELVVEDSVNDVRPYVYAAVVRDVSLDEDSLIALMNIQEKLHITHGRNRKKVAIGVHDLSKVEAPFTYKAVRPTDISFVPLGMEKELDLAQILKEHPKGVEYRHILEEFDRYPVILDNLGRVLSFPPVINGELTRVGVSSTDLFIDITGTDEKAVSQALNILVSGLVDRGGRAYTVTIT